MNVTGKTARSDALQAHDQLGQIRSKSQRYVVLRRLSSDHISKEGFQKRGGSVNCPNPEADLAAERG